MNRTFRDRDHLYIFNEKGYTPLPFLFFGGPMLRILLLIFVVPLAACTTLEVTEVDPDTGLLPSMSGSEASVVVNKPFDIDSRKSLAVATGADFVTGQLKELGFFDEVIDREGLEKAIVAANLTDDIPSVQDRIGLNRAAKFYKPFMWVHFEVRSEGRTDYLQIVLTDPITMEDLFVAERVMDFAWAGVNDQNTFYPVFNALIDYLKDNSETYGK